MVSKEEEGGRRLSIVPAGDGEEVFGVGLRLGGGQRAVPMYTSSVGRSVFRGAAGVLPWGLEGWRFARDYLAELSTRTEFSPQRAELIDGGYGARLILPVVQIGAANWASTSERVGAAVDAFAKEASFGSLLSPERRLPPGRQIGQDVQYPVAREGRTRDFRQQVAETLTGGIPFAVMEVAMDPVERAQRSFHERSGVSSPESERMRFPSVNVSIELSWIDREMRRGLRQGKVVFPLGILPLQFTDQGEVANSPYRVEARGKRTYYHPALLGLRDLSGVMSAVIRRQSKGAATVLPETIAEGLVVASTAGGSMEAIMTSHLERMVAIESIERLLATDPGVVLLAIPDVLRFVDAQGQFHPKFPDVMGEISEAVLSTQAVAEQPHPATTWAQLLFTVNSVCQKHRAMAVWEGQRLMVADLLAHASGMQDLRAIYENMLGKQARQPLQGQRPLPAVALLADGNTPINILRRVQSLYLERGLQGTLSRDAAERQLAAMEAIEAMSGEYTAQVQAFWRGMEERFRQEIQQLGPLGSSRGEEAGRRAVEHFSGVQPEQHLKEPRMPR